MLRHRAASRNRCFHLERTNAAVKPKASSMFPPSLSPWSPCIPPVSTCLPKDLLLTLFNLTKAQQEHFGGKPRARCAGAHDVHVDVVGVRHYGGAGVREAAEMKSRICPLSCILPSGRGSPN